VGKGKRLKRVRKGVGKDFLKEYSDRLTRNFQEEIRNSDIWNQMVAEFGEERTEELLKEMKADIKPGPGPYGSWDSTEDIP
jgi:hypothetical protein